MSNLEAINIGQQRAFAAKLTLPKRRVSQGSIAVSQGTMTTPASD
jgi:hypothetical protein